MLKSKEGAERAYGFVDWFMKAGLFPGSVSRKRLECWLDLGHVNRSSEAWHRKKMKQWQALRRLFTRNPRKRKAKKGQRT